MKQQRRRVLRAIAGLGAVLVGTTAVPAAAQGQGAFPSRAVTLVVPFAAGGFTDNVGRLVAQGLSERWKVPVLVDNRAGAGGNLGAAYAAKQPADGYTLFLANTASNVVNTLIYKNPGFDAATDFEPVIMLVKTANVVTVGNDIKATTIDELVKLARQKPNSLNFGTPGTGTTGHFTGELFSRVAGVQMQHVPYKGTPAVQADMINGTLQVAFDNVTSWAPQVTAGRVRALAVTSPKRSPLLPNVPTLQELGYAGFEATTFAGIAVPRGTPREVIARINADVEAVIQGEEFKRRMGGAEVVGGTAASFKAYIDAEVDKWGRVARDINLTVN
jgi:tripartite-type tricarboxylate transporter receptor subunit TctC